MNSLVRAYMGSKDCKKSKLDTITYKVTDKCGKQFICKFSIKYDHWEC